ADFSIPAKVREIAAKDGGAAAGGCRIDLVDAQPAATIRLRVAKDAVRKQIAIALPEIMEHLVAIGAEMAGQPFARWHSFGEKDGEEGGEIALECGIPVKKAIEKKGRIQPSQLPGGRVAATWHTGSYQELPQAYARLRQWMSEQHLAAAGAPWEIYWTDPGLVADQTQWRTQILWPLQPVK